MPPRVLFVLVLVALLAPAAASAQPRVAAFYYPWYGTAARDGGYWHWGQNGRQPPGDLASDFFPARGPYSSGDPAVLAAQMAEIRAAGIGEIVVSWWGWGSPEDARLPVVIRAARARGLVVAVHLEPYPGRTAGSVLADVGHLQALGVRDVYVYRPHDLTASDWGRVNALLPGIRMWAQTPLVGFAAAGGFKGVYTYDILLYSGGSFGRLCAEAHRAHLLCAPSVGPGYSARRATGDLREKPRHLGATYDGMWRAALDARPDQVTITSYNEWNEGTQIEPARSFDTPPGYQSYDGAWGLVGRAAQRAYLDRTFCWSRAFTRGYPFTTPIGSSFATGRASPARSTIRTTCSTSL